MKTLQKERVGGNNSILLLNTNKKNKKKMLDKNRNFHFMIQNFSANLNAEDPTVKSDYIKIIKIIILSLLAV